MSNTHDSSRLEGVKVFCRYFASVIHYVFVFTQIENILIDDNGTYVLCDFGSATNIVFSTITHPITVVEEEITRCHLKLCGTVRTHRSNEFGLTAFSCD